MSPLERSPEPSMAKPIVVSYGGTESSFAISRINRSKLYGRRQRFPLDPTGERCQRASLTDDGSLLVVSGMVAQGYFDSNGAWVPNNQLVGLDPDGEVVERIPSTLGVAQPLEGPVPPTEVLDLQILSVYLLEPEEIDMDLAHKLANGEIFKFGFSYRGGYNQETGVLVGNDEGLFALIGRPKVLEWSELEQVVQPLLEEEDDDFDDDLDFEMF